MLRETLESQTHNAPVLQSSRSVVKLEPELLCWIEDQQAVSIFPASVATKFYSTDRPLIPSGSTIPHSEAPTKPRIIFPLSCDHLLTLLQYNVLRGCLINHALISNLKTTPSSSTCSSSSLSTLPSSLPPNSLPPSLYLTLLQQQIPHEEWIDIIPHTH